MAVNPHTPMGSALFAGLRFRCPCHPIGPRLNRKTMIIAAFRSAAPSSMIRKPSFSALLMLANAATPAKGFSRSLPWCLPMAQPLSSIAALFRKHFVIKLPAKMAYLKAL